MIVKCPECELQVSDKAVTCPHCGYPLQPEAKQRKPRSKNRKRRRLPNGFGQISEIKNQNLRNPFRAMVTVGKDENGRPICKPLKPVAYFPTYNDAYAALVEYNRNPYDLNPDITVKELYDRWFAEYSKKAKKVTPITSTWNYCSSIYDMPVKDVRARHIRGCMEHGTYVINGQTRTTSAAMKERIKSLFNMLLDYALEYEIVDKNYARTFKVDKEITKERAAEQRGHMPFTDEEIELLWSHVDDTPIVNLILIQCYSGWRPTELIQLTLDNVDLEQGSYRGGMKTAAGTNRLVPIHSKIRYLVEQKYHEAQEKGSPYLFNDPAPSARNKTGYLNYDRYLEYFHLACEQLGLNPEHRPHDGRKHFVTMAKKYNVDEYAIKYIVGHSITDVTEKVYTEREFSWLQSEIEKIK